jgi:hypothetical protein
MKRNQKPKRGSWAWVFADYDLWCCAKLASTPMRFARQMLK